MDFHVGGLYLKEVEQWRGKIITKLKLTRSDGATVESGSTLEADHFKYVVGCKQQPYCFEFCTVQTAPDFEALVGLSLIARNEDQTLVSVDSVQLCKTPMRSLDYHSHFDPIGKYKAEFRKLVSLDFVTAGDNEIVEFSMSFTVNEKEDKMLCPMEARLNPLWRCKEWEALITEKYEFYGSNHYITKKVHTFTLDSKEGECITRVRGVKCNSVITLLEFTTNFGHKFTVGHD